MRIPPTISLLFLCLLSFSFFLLALLSIFGLLSIPFQHANKNSRPHNSSSNNLTYEIPTTLTRFTKQTVTRIACFRFLPNVTAAQKADRTSAFLDLYGQHRNLILGMPEGGRPLDASRGVTDVEMGNEGWDTGFVVMFKDDAARREFDSDKGHDKLKNETDILLEQVFVYDFLAQDNLGW